MRREDFPILKEQVNGRQLVYLDNAATTQLPLQVIDAMRDHYLHDNANVHRGIHTLSERSTRNFEGARKTVQRYLNARRPEEIVFTSGTTDSLNTLARLLEPLMGEGNVIAVTALEHHANYVPWQQLCLRTGAMFEVIDLTPEGDVDLVRLNSLLEAGNVKLFSCAHVSNVLGTVSPVAEMARICHEAGALFCVDAAQSIRHESVDVQAIDCDFLAFSGHKTCAPTGIGVLYGRKETLETLRPVNFGGEMVDKVAQEGTTFEELPLRLEAGTPNYPGAIALGAALSYLEEIGRNDIAQREYQLLKYVEDGISRIPNLHVLGNPAKRAGCLSFTGEGLHPFDIAMLMDKRGIALRSGNQCAQPLLHGVYGIKNITRISPAFYNTEEEIDTCLETLEMVCALLRKALR